MYKLLRPLLFLLPPEIAHHWTLCLLKAAHRCKIVTLVFPKQPIESIQVAGLTFKNRIGIAAGLDKNGDYIDALAALGVGFIEVGAVTPKPQTGNPKPRLFRLPTYRALINRMGFNNKGVDYLVENLKRRKTNCVIGVNLGKNKETSLDVAYEDYNACLKKVFAYADFATINISSPSTPNIRLLQTPHYLQQLLIAVKSTRDALQKTSAKQLPLFVKIAPDLTDDEVLSLLNVIVHVGLDGVIATNTAFFREGVMADPLAQEAGGLSGSPLTERSFSILQLIQTHHPTLPVISLGGIDSTTEAQRRFNAGADLIQLYTGLIYEGPSLIQKLIKEKI